MASNQDNTIDNTKMIHVVHIASGDLWAGAEVMLYNLVKSLQLSPDLKVTVVLLNHGALEEKLRDTGTNLYVLDESRLNGFQILRQLNQLIGKLKPDVIHTHRIKENILGSIAAQLNNIPSIRTTHGAPEHRPPIHKLAKRLILYVDRILGRFAQKYIVAVSDDLATKLSDNFTEPKIKVVVNGIDIDSIKQTISQETTNKISAGKYRIGIAGRLVTVKRVDLFIDCAYYLKQHNPDLAIHYYIYGDGPLLETLRSQVKSYHADDYIHFEGHSENLTQEMQKLDALVMTSDHEGLPMVLLEAMTLQTPIIAHAVGGIPDLLEQGKCGTLVYEHTAEAFAIAIDNLTKQQKRTREHTKQAFKRIEDCYSAKRTAKAYISIYQSLK